MVLCDRRTWYGLTLITQYILMNKHTQTPTTAKLNVCIHCNVHVQQILNNYTDINNYEWQHSFYHGWKTDWKEHMVLNSMKKLNKACADAYTPLQAVCGDSCNEPHFNHSFTHLCAQTHTHNHIPIPWQYTAASAVSGHRSPGIGSVLWPQSKTLSSLPVQLRPKMYNGVRELVR